MNIKGMISGLALLCLGAWCLYRGISNWKFKASYPSRRYIIWGIFSMVAGIVIIVLGWVGYWWTYNLTDILSGKIK